MKRCDRDKHLVGMTLALGLILLAGVTAHTQTTAPSTTPTAAPADFVPPSTSPGDDGWLVYVDAATYTAENVADLAPGTSTAEAAVVHYFASRVRGDQRFREVLAPAEHASRWQEEGIAQHDEWSFNSFRLVGRKDNPDGQTWIRVFFEITFGDRTDSGTDECTVQQIDGQWFVIDVPT